jgi:hypothetical protein
MSDFEARLATLRLHRRDSPPSARIEGEDGEEERKRGREEEEEEEEGKERALREDRGNEDGTHSALATAPRGKRESGEGMMKKRH